MALPASRDKILVVSTSSPTDRKHAPVFVMGCHRSGTNLLYDMLLSSGGFAIYRGFLPIYKILIPKFGSMQNRGNREKILETWIRSKGFRRTGLDADKLSARILNEARNGGDFIRIVMESVTEHQKAQRWAVYDPDNVLHVERDKRDIPNALFVHIIRDGRDIALSLKKMGGFAPLPWDRGQTDSLVATSLYWEWMIRRGRQSGSQFPADYIEIRYEDLITKPHETLGRWKERLAHEDVAAIESTVGNSLKDNGYELSLAASERDCSARHLGMRGIYPAFLNSKLWLKLHTPVGRLANMAALELEDDSAPITESVRS
jgi:hypothetical protein